MKRLLTQFQNLRFKHKLFISYLVVCIIPVVVLGAFSYSQANDFLVRQAEQNLSGSVDQAADTVNFRTEQYEAIFESVTQNIVFKQIFMNAGDDFPELYRDYVDPFFNNVLNLNADILQISVFTDDDRLLRGEYILPMELAEGSNWVERSEAERTLWVGRNGKVFATRAFAPPAGGAVRPARAVLFLSIDAERLFSALNDVAGGEYAVFVRDEQGNDIWTKRGADVPEGIRSHLPAEAGKRGYAQADGESFLYMTASLPETGWVVSYVTPKRGISVDATSIVKATGLIVLICLAVLLLVIGIFSNTFVKRINHLNKLMSVVEKGNLDIEVFSHSRDEIGQLTNRFGRMLDNVNRLIDEVYKGKIVQREAELKTLQTQINPHFLYNTLSILNWKAIEIDAMEISRIVTTISKFYRTVLNKGKNMTPVRSEVENAEAYMQIQLIMHGGSFDFRCEIEEPLYQYDMIHLILQPILENALEHGIDRLPKGERRGCVALRGREDGGDIVFEIEDNGPGMPEEAIAAALEDHAQGYGLRNVHDRIRIRFGSRYGLELSAEPGVGTKVTVRLPKHVERPDEPHE